MKRYILEKHYEGEWYYEGVYTEANIAALVQTVFWLGRNGRVYDDVRVREENYMKHNINFSRRAFDGK